MRSPLRSGRVLDRGFAMEVCITNHYFLLKLPSSVGTLISSNLRDLMAPSELTFYETIRKAAVLLQHRQAFAITSGWGVTIRMDRWNVQSN